MLVAVNVLVSNLFDAVNVNCWDFIVAEIALLVFFKR
jgi:hypothetical protein